MSAAIPITTAEPVSPAFLLGCSDAESNAPCTPEMFYVRHEFIQRYCEGYLSVNWTPEALLTARHYGCEVQS